MEEHSKIISHSLILGPELLDLNQLYWCVCDTRRTALQALAPSCVRLGDDAKRDYISTPSALATIGMNPREVGTCSETARLCSISLSGGSGGLICKKDSLSTLTSWFIPKTATDSDTPPINFSTVTLPGSRISANYPSTWRACQTRLT
jgi:hypothetical protein